jgi:CpeT/CpcT family (DUF1001)
MTDRPLSMLSVLLGALSIAPGSFATQPPIPIAQQVNEVADYLVGAMDTSAQAIANPNAPNVRITTCDVRVENPPNDTRFLYQEQARSDKLSQPYRQRFLQITASPDGTQVESIAFKPEHPEQWIGLCDRGDREIPPAQFGEAVCRVFLQPDGEGYVGNTPEEGCPTHFRGAVRITNTVILRRLTMETWDRGFDADGKQVWGAIEDSYQFRDIEPAE